MSAFFLYEPLEVTDEEKIAEYRAGAGATVARYEGSFRVVGGSPAAVEGDWTPRSLVLVEFPTIELARAWYDSAEYEPFKQLRLAGSSGNAVLLEGRPAAG